MPRKKRAREDVEEEIDETTIEEFAKYEDDTDDVDALVDALVEEAESEKENPLN